MDPAGRVRPSCMLYLTRYTSMCVGKSTQTALRAFGANSSVLWTGHITPFRRSTCRSMWTSLFGDITAGARHFSLYWSQRLRSGLYQLLESKFSNHMNILSLFDGISCARVALERTGIPITKYYASEIDKNAIAVSTKNYPDTIQLGDVKTITNDLIASYMGNVEIGLMISGSPCQDLSIAQKNRKGLDGERSGLFWEYVRILKEAKPRWFILENVASMSKEAKEVITRELGVEPIMINAALVSAQNRKRLFWTNIPNVKLPDDRGIFLKDILEPKVDEIYNVDISKNKRIKGFTENERGLRFHRGDKSKTGISELGRIVNENSKTDTQSTNHAPTIRIGQIGKGGQGDRIYSPDGKSINLSANGGGRGAKTGLYAVALTETRTEKGKKIRNTHYKKTGKDWSPRREKELKIRNDDKANTLMTN